MPTPSSSTEVAGLEAPATIRLDDRELSRNGVGIRRATRLLLTADIYVAALYLTRPSSDPDEILGSNEPKELRLKYLYAIDGDGMKRAWQYSFDKNCPDEDCARHTQAISQFLEHVRGVEPGDTYTYRFRADRAEIELPSGETHTVPGGEFSSLLLSTWIGRVPPSEELKTALLGISPSR